MPHQTSQPLSPAITVSIVSHRQWALILPLLEDLDLHCHDSVARVLLTVNVEESEQPVLRSLRFQVEVIRNRKPLGYGANHNQAFKQCATPWFLILNPDIRLSSDILAPMLATAGKRSAILAPRIFEPPRHQAEPHRALLTPLEIVTRRKPAYVAPASPDWIPGLFMLFRAEAFAAIGGFDERYFMYGEDFDICARARLAGWHLQIDETRHAEHDARRASHRSWRALHWHVSSLLKVWTSAAFWRYLRFLRG
jgi:N-acetylglucosaminyl-diphospho-decaprenol L-rhamnosyltransferase